MAPIVRPYWPPVRCRGAVVGLQVGGDVLGEALLAGVTSTHGGAAWAFGAVTPYLRTLPHVLGRGMSSPMPEAPPGTLTPARNWDDDFLDGLPQVAYTSDMSLERNTAVSTFTRSNTRISCMCCGARAPYTDTPVDAPGAGLAITRTILRGLAWSFLWESKTKAGKRVSAWDADRRLVTRCPDCTHRLRPAPLEAMT